METRNDASGIQGRALLRRESRAALFQWAVSGVLMLLSTGCQGPGWYFPPPEPRPRQAPGVFQGSATLPSDYPAYEEPAHLLNSSGTPTGQNRLAVSGPASADKVWEYRVEGSISARPVLGEDGNLYVLAGGVMLVYSLAGKEMRRFNADSARLGGRQLFWLEGAGPAWRNSEGEIVCCSPVGERLWSWSEVDVTRDWPLPGGGLLALGRTGENASRLSALNPDGSTAWSLEHAGTDIVQLEPAADSSLTVLYWSGGDALVRLDAAGQKLWSFSPQLAAVRFRQLSDGRIEVDEQAELFGGPQHTLGWVCTRETLSAQGALLDRVLLFDDNFYGPTGPTGETWDGVVVTDLPTNKPLLNSMPEGNFTYDPNFRDLTWGAYQAKVSDYSLTLVQSGSVQWSISTGVGTLERPLFETDGRAWITTGPLSISADLNSQQLSRQHNTDLGGSDYRQVALGPGGERYFNTGQAVLKLSRQGARLAQWSPPAGQPYLSQMICGPDGTVYAATLASPGGIDDPAIYALSPTLELYWRYVDELDIRQPISVAQDGSILFFSEDYREEAHQAYSALPAGRAASYEVSGPPFGWQGGSLKRLNRDGSTRWSLPLGGPPLGPPVAGDQGHVYWVEAEAGADYYAIGSWDEGQMLRSASPQGNLRWETALPAPSGGVLAQLGSGALLLHLYQPADGGKPPLWLAAFDPADGSERWRFERQGYSFNSGIADKDGKYYCAATMADSQDQAVLVLDSSGHLQTEWELPRSATYFNNISVALSPDGDLCATNEDTFSVWRD